MDKAPIEVWDMTPVMLDWAVAIAIGHIPNVRSYLGTNKIIIEDFNRPDSVVRESAFSPASNDLHSCILVDRYGLGVFKFNPDLHLSEDFTDTNLAAMQWWCESYSTHLIVHGPDRRIAIARQVVLAELGEIVEIPLILVEK